MCLTHARLELMRPEVCRFDELCEVIRHRPPRCGRVRLVAVDGPGGAGKSVFAERLARSLGGVPIIHTDEFASWENPLGWWSRLEDDVLMPLAKGQLVRYREYDWSRRRLGRWRVIPSSEVILLEGVSAARRAVAERLSLSIWIEAPTAVRLARGLDRDGQAMRGQWKQWMAEEATHYAKDQARERAGVIVDGAPTVPHDPEIKFICLKWSEVIRRLKQRLVPAER
jgi:uridine kinase